MGVVPTIGYVVRRFIQAIIVVLGVVLITQIFWLLLGPTALRESFPPRTPPSTIHHFFVLMGFNLPFPFQFVKEVGNLFTGNFGYSLSLNQSVFSAISVRLPRTVLLLGTSTVLALLIAIPLGVLQVVRRNKPIDYALTGASFFFYGMPTFFLGVVLVQIFAVHWHLFSAEGPQVTNLWSIFTDWRGFTLPVLTLAAVTIASFSRYMRSSMMEQMTEDYIRTARAKGMRNRRVLYLHGLRNALIPIVTLLGLSLPGIVGGALVTESVFNFPGMGLLFLHAAEAPDYPLLIGTSLLATIATVVGSLLADIAYAVLDPRIRYS
jgi:peptide/nickel transport system permease protein